MAKPQTIDLAEGLSALQIHQHVDIIQGTYEKLPNTRRLWSREYAGKILQEIGEIARYGGIKNLQTMNLRRLNDTMRNNGFVNVMVYDPAVGDSYEPLNEPDWEATYWALRNHPESQTIPALTSKLRKTTPAPEPAFKDRTCKPSPENNI